MPTPLKLHRLPNNDKERLKVYDQIFFKAMQRMDEDNTAVKVELTVAISPNGIVLLEPYSWFKDWKP